MANPNEYDGVECYSKHATDLMWRVNDLENKWLEQSSADSVTFEYDWHNANPNNVFFDSVSGDFVAVAGYNFGSHPTESLHVDFRLFHYNVSTNALVKTQTITSPAVVGESGGSANYFVVNGKLHIGWFNYVVDVGAPIEYGAKFFVYDIGGASASEDSSHVIDTGAGVSTLGSTFAGNHLLYDGSGLYGGVANSLNKYNVSSGSLAWSKFDLGTFHTYRHFATDGAGQMYAAEGKAPGNVTQIFNSGGTDVGTIAMGGPIGCGGPGNDADKLYGWTDPTSGSVGDTVGIYVTDSDIVTNEAIPSSGILCFPIDPSGTYYALGGSTTNTTQSTIDEYSTVTNWDGYVNGTTSQSIGTFPDDNDLSYINCSMVARQLIDIRVAIEALDDDGMKFARGISAFTGAGGLFHQSHTRTQFGGTTIRGSDWTHDEATLNANDLYDIDIGEIERVIAYIELFRTI